MNREEYMKLLKKKLRHLPRGEFERAVEYFEEYFDEAGPDQEQQAIADLGTPEEAAGQIIQDIAIRNTMEPVTDVKKGVSAVWVGILAVFAAPFALPVMLAVGIVAVMMFVLAVLMMIMFFLTGVLLFISGPVSVVGGFTVIGESVGAACICFGRGLAAAGAGILLMQVMYAVLRRFLSWLVRLFGKMLQKEEKEDD